MHSPLKKVLNKIEDSYQTYINTYKLTQWQLAMEEQVEPQRRTLTPRNKMSMLTMNIRRM